MELLVARQPIFDAQLRVCAYELLFRSSLNNAFDSPGAGAYSAAQPSRQIQFALKLIY